MSVCCIFFFGNYFIFYSFRGILLYNLDQQLFYTYRWWWQKRLITWIPGIVSLFCSVTWYYYSRPLLFLCEKKKSLLYLQMSLLISLMSIRQLWLSSCKSSTISVVLYVFNYHKNFFVTTLFTIRVQFFSIVSVIVVFNIPIVRILILLFSVTVPLLIFRNNVPDVILPSFTISSSVRTYSFVVTSSKLR